MEGGNQLKTWHVLFIFPGIKNTITAIVFVSRQILPHFVISLDLGHWDYISVTTFLKKNDA